MLVIDGHTAWFSKNVDRFRIITIEVPNESTRTNTVRNRNTFNTHRNKNSTPDDRGNYRETGGGGG